MHKFNFPVSLISKNKNKKTGKINNIFSLAEMWKYSNFNL